MATRDLSVYKLYRWRYTIGYTLIGLLMTALFVFAGLFLPGGLSQAEMNTTVTSAAISFSDPSTLSVTNLPYHLLQSLVFHLFGVTTFTIKLPSLILGILTAIGFILLLRRWFKPNIAVLASLIAISTGQFLFITQSGTASILYLFWPVFLLWLGTQITRNQRFRLLWKILFAATAALSLYTPLGIYPLIAIALTVALHPHLRSVLRKLSRPRLAIVTGVFLVLIAPLVFFIVRNPQLLPSLLGIPSEIPDFSANITTILSQYFVFWDTSTAAVMTPFFGLGTVILIGLGLYRLIRTIETTRSYLIIIWLVCIVPVLLINPAFTSFTYTPAVLMIAAGLATLIDYWYRLFPRNPYARISGLIPIVVLVTALILTGLTRYVQGYQYNPEIVPLFSKDLRILPDNTSQLVVSKAEKPFYQSVAKFSDELDVVEAPTKADYTATRNARIQREGSEIRRIIVNPLSNESDRFYIYQKIEK